MSSKRGSEKMFLESRRLSEKDLVALKELVEIEGVVLHDWCIYGQPAPDAVCGKFQVEPEVALQVVAQLIRDERLRVVFEVFPLGIPVPDLYQIEFATQRHLLR